MLGSELVLIGLILLYGQVSTAPSEKMDINLLVLLPMKAPNGYIFPFGMEMCGGAGKSIVNE